ncbi:nuclear transport factor 2 family protein [Spongiibacter marinus]|uniref:nuclear transport factor 2 family protein n=1 Tax=Spongiibacter marinus TaxID=354246 RepID=UPI001961F79D|nr:nuclear transport factor 2 family protein [Spongiibacter marinus]MBM7423579.1 ketosteroid isomerase-like protein [Spongiibacter marinus]
MHPTIKSWHQLLSRRDTTGLENLLADDAVFHSPIVHTPQRGKDVTAQYLSAAFQVLVNDSFHYVREVEGANDAVLEFAVVIDGVQVNGVDMIRWNAEGKITDFKVMLRPLKAINLIHQKMAEMLEALAS